MKVKVLKNKSGKIIATFEPQSTSEMTMETQVLQLEPEVSKGHTVEEMEMPEDYASRLDDLYKKKPDRKKRED
jgi:hypothetical protein